MNRFPTINLGALGQNDKAPLPFPPGVLYRHPNPDGSRKNCGNCIMWVANEDRCVIHPRDLRIGEDEMCGYHVFGQPMPKWMDHPGIMPVTPDISGLRMAGPGVACASCVFYKKQSDQGGLCMGVANPETGQAPVPVESRGWCTRYVSM